VIAGFSERAFSVASFSPEAFDFPDVEVVDTPAATRSGGFRALRDAKVHAVGGRRATYVHMARAGVYPIAPEVLLPLVAPARGGATGGRRARLGHAATTGAAAMVRCEVAARTLRVSPARCSGGGAQVAEGATRVSLAGAAMAGGRAAAMAHGNVVFGESRDAVAHGELRLTNRQIAAAVTARFTSRR
jgi:hypothetical protein